MNKNLALFLVSAALLSGCASRSTPRPDRADTAPAHTDSVAVDRQAPVYSMESRRAGEQGLVKLQVLVSAEGKPVKAFLLRSSGYPRLDESAKAAVLKWRFTPAQVKGKPVEEWVLVPVQFVLKP
jgi:protein TonB